MTHDEKIVEAVARAIARNIEDERFWDAPGFQNAARAAITAFQAEAWQPIETAPKERKDGALVQVLLIGHFDNGYITDIVQGWWDLEYWARWKHHVPPTHWQPLPNPPASP